MNVSGSESLDKILRLDNITSEKHVIYRIRGTFYIRRIEDFLKNLDFNDEVHVLMFNGANLYIDIDTKTEKEFEYSLGRCKELVANIERYHPMGKIYPVIISSRPTSIHLHINGIWFNKIQEIPAYLERLKFGLYDKDVYKNLSSLRIGLCRKNNSDKRYRINDTFGRKYNRKNLKKILTPSIPPKQLNRRLLVKFVYKKSVLNTYTFKNVQHIENVKRVLVDNYGIYIEKFELRPGHIYIIPQKPWPCPKCHRSHNSNNLTISNKGVLRCYA